MDAYVTVLFLSGASSFKSVLAIQPRCWSPMKGFLASLEEIVTYGELPKCLLQVNEFLTQSGLS